MSENLSRISEFRLTRFQYRRDRDIGDSQVRFSLQHAVALELTDGAGRTGLGFAGSLFDPLSSLAALTATFATQVWPGLEGAMPAALIHRVDRPRGGNRRDAAHGFSEAIQIALWDLAAQSAGIPLADYLGGRRRRVPAYASGLDFHMTDAEYTAFFTHAASKGFRAFKIKVGHPDPDWDIHRMELLQRAVGPRSAFMIDANEAWTAKQAATRLHLFHKAGFDPVWVEDPILRDDFDGLKMLSAEAPWTLINSGEYLDLTGRRALLQARATDILNVHGRITDVMRIGWLAADMGVPVSLGNTFLETGVHTACALSEVEWLEYSFLNYDHLVDEPYLIQDGFIHVPDVPGVGLRLSDSARRDWAAPEPLAPDAIRTGPPCRLRADAAPQWG